MRESSRCHPVDDLRMAVGGRTESYTPWTAKKHQKDLDCTRDTPPTFSRHARPPPVRDPPHTQRGGAQSAVDCAAGGARQARWTAPTVGSAADRPPAGRGAAAPRLDPAPTAATARSGRDSGDWWALFRPPPVRAALTSSAWITQPTPHRPCRAAAVSAAAVMLPRVPLRGGTRPPNPKRRAKTPPPVPPRSPPTPKAKTVTIVCDAIGTNQRPRRTVLCPMEPHIHY